LEEGSALSVGSLAVSSLSISMSIVCRTVGVSAFRFGRVGRAKIGQKGKRSSMFLLFFSEKCMVQ
jgi:hypothetical protein